MFPSTKKKNLLGLIFTFIYVPFFMYRQIKLFDKIMHRCYLIFIDLHKYSLMACFLAQYISTTIQKTTQNCQNCTQIHTQNVSFHKIEQKLKKKNHTKSCPGLINRPCTYWLKKHKQTQFILIHANTKILFSENNFLKYVQKTYDSFSDTNEKEINLLQLLRMRRVELSFSFREKHSFWN